MGTKADYDENNLVSIKVNSYYNSFVSLLSVFYFFVRKFAKEGMLLTYTSMFDIFNKLLPTLLPMSSTHIFFLMFNLLLQIVIAADPLKHVCSNTFTYTLGSPYEKNLNILLDELIIRVPPTGFELSSVGSPKEKETVHGLALCRGDISTSDCRSCVDIASKEILQLCPSDKGGIIWYDACLLRYSNIDFFGTINSATKVYLYDMENVSDIAAFSEKKKEFLGRLTEKAYRSPMLFATSETRLGELDHLYGLAQCTRDLSSIQCKKCLDDSINAVSNSDDEKQGGRLISGSCSCRYELYPFALSRECM